MSKRNSKRSLVMYGNFILKKLVASMAAGPVESEERSVTNQFPAVRIALAST